MTEHAFSRTELLIGSKALEILQSKKVVVLGIGGVGSFAAEALVRSGIGKLVLVDHDNISITNINRQIHANFRTIGRPKVEVMKERISDINPQCEVEVFQTFIKRDNLEEMIPFNTDYVVDAIDTVSSKLDVITYCKEHNIKIISSMGTGNKLDPTQFKITDIYKTSVCPLAKVMRHEIRKRNIDSLKVLFSPEEPKKQQPSSRTPASISFVPPVAGMIIAGEVVKELILV